MELRSTSGAPPKGNPWAMQIERLAVAVDEESKGEFKIQTFLASQLGNEHDTVQQVTHGRIDMGGFSTGSEDPNGVKTAAYASKSQRESQRVSQMVTYGSLGATAIPLGLPEWIAAFQTGMAQVVMTPMTYALPSGLTKVAPVARRWGMVDRRRPST